MTNTVQPGSKGASPSAAFNTQINQLQQQVQDLFDQHRDVEIYLSQPGLGDILGTPGTRRVQRRPRPLRRRPGPQELRRQQSDHPRLGQEDAPSPRNYALLLDDAHHAELAQRVNYAALTSTLGELPGQLDLLTDSATTDGGARS